MGGRGVAERGSQGVDLTLDDDVELARHAVQQQVAHGAADEMHAPAPRRGVEQPPTAGQFAQRHEEIVHPDSLAARRSGRPDRRPPAAPAAQRRLAPPRSLPWLA